MKTICLLSGGLDSTVLAAKLLAEGHQVIGLSCNYGQRHAVELDAARRVASRLGIEHLFADLAALRPLLAAGGSSQVSDTPVPRGHYAEASMKATVVPNRNMLLLATAGAVAVAQGADSIAYAAHAGDHAIYPDCRPPFAEAMRNALLLCDWAPVELLRPFIEMSKTEIAALGFKLGAPMEATWSCYDPQPIEGGIFIHCGACGTCYERREAFRDADLCDPTHYAATPTYEAPHES